MDVIDRYYPAYLSTADNGTEEMLDILSATVTHVIDGIYDLVAEYPTAGPLMAYIKPDAIISAADPLGHDLDETMHTMHRSNFRIYRVTTSMNGIATIYAHHTSYDLGRLIVDPFGGTYTTPRAAMSAVWYYRRSGDVGPGWTVVATDAITGSWTAPNRPANFKQLMTEVQRAYPGTYWEYQGSSTAALVAYPAPVGQHSGEYKVRLGENLLSLKKDINDDTVYTQVKGFWRGTVNGQTVYRYGDAVRTGATETIDRLAWLDLSDEFTSEPTTADLTAATEAHKAEYPTAPIETIEASFLVDPWLHIGPGTTFMLGHPVWVYNPDLGIDHDLYLTKTTANSLRGTLERVTVGTPSQTLANVLMNIRRGKQ